MDEYLNETCLTCFYRADDVDICIACKDLGTKDCDKWLPRMNYQAYTDIVQRFQAIADTLAKKKI